MPQHADTLFIVTGAPGAGKTTLLDAAASTGMIVGKEAARAVIQSQAAIDGPAVQWREPAMFGELMLDRDIQTWETHHKMARPVLCDRGIPDLVAFARMLKLRDCEHFHRASMLYRYNPVVFFAPPWPEIFVTPSEPKTCTTPSASMDRCVTSTRNWAIASSSCPRRQWLSDWLSLWISSPMPEPTIFVDADACPVKDEAMRVAERLGLVVTLVSNGGIRPSRDPMVRVVVVAAGADAADDWIVDHAVANDIVLTADIPLASRAIDKGCHVLGFTGKAFTPASIGMALAMRDLKQHLRETGEIKGYNAGFRPADRSAFLSALDTLGRKAKATGQNL